MKMKGADPMSPAVRWTLAGSMRRGLVVLGALVAVATGCATVPVTGRQHLSFIPNSQLVSLSAQSYRDVLETGTLSTDPEATAMVRRVGERIRAAVEKYMGEQGLGHELSGYAWEFNLIQDERVNAWCMAGGKVVFYTGILPFCGDETGVAVVMGHEIAHAVARHGNERMSQGLIQQLGGMALTVAMKEKPAETRDLFMTAYGAGTQVGVMLPFSRLQETEADRMGLIFMAMAGYDPREAPRFWGRMAAGDGKAPPEFLSTHPAQTTRIRSLEEFMPEALRHYRTD